VSLAATASDDVGVQSVQFFLDGSTSLGVDTTAPYVGEWNSTTASNGSHTLTAVARDTAGNQTTSSGVAVTTANPAFVNETVVPGITDATTIAFLPGGRMLIGELSEKILVVQPGANQPDPTPFLQLDSSRLDGEQGLLDILPDQNFAQNGFYFIFYTHGTAAGNHQRVSRFTASGNGTVPGSEVVLWEDPDGAGACCHGGSLAFGADGKLYISTGDNTTPADAQRLDAPRGKILRINKDGTIPSDNPFVDGTGPNRDEIWALGLRNPFRMTIDPVTGRMYIGDIGSGDHSVAKEELNVGVRGANYGWPVCEGPCSASGMTNPTFSYPHGGRDACIIAGIVYRGSQFPSEYQGSLFVGDYVQHTVKRMKLDGSGNLTQVMSFWPADGSLDDLSVGDPVKFVEGPDGSLYYVDIGFFGGEQNPASIRRIRYTLGNRPPVAVATATPTTGQAPLPVTFSSAGSSDPEGAPLSYSWTFGDGGTSTQANPTHTYQAAGQYVARLTVSDGTNTAVSSDITIRVGTPPTPRILTPANGTLFRAGDLISYSGSATDAEDGALPASAFSWTILFHHDSHIHPGGGPFTNTTSGTLQIPTTGHEYAGATSYEIVLTVTDSTGLTASTSVTVLPDKVNVTYDTVPSGLTVTIDGISRQTPYVVDDLKGFQHTIDAPNQSSGGTAYTFASWSDGGAQSHNIVVPNVDQSYVATLQGSAGPGGLVGAYSFNEGAGSSVGDASGSGNGGSIGSATWSTAGKYGNALSFNGTSARVTVPDSPSLRLTNGMTLEAWVFPTTVNGVWRDVIYKGNDNYYLEATSSPGRPVGGGIFGGNYGEAYGTSNLVANTWTHLTATYDGTALKLFVNGTQVSSFPSSGPIATSNGVLSIGGDPLYGQFFAGRIDDVRIYNRALTQAQIQSDMATPIGGTAGDGQPPTAPTSLAATASSSTQVGLAWTAATDNVGVVQYRIERCQGAGCSVFAEVGTVTGTSFTDSGRSPSTAYSYRVRAQDAALNLGPYSNTASATTPAVPDTEPPTAPTGLVATASSSTQVGLAWTAATDNVGVVQYRIERCQGAGCSAFSEIATVTGTSFTDSGRSPSTSYSYRVRAQDAALHLGPYSNTASVTTPAADAQPPTAPTGLTATASSSTQVGLAWTAATDNVGVVQYRVERCQGAGCSSFTEIATVPGTSFTDSGRSPSTAYSYRVRAQDAALNLGPYSSTASVTTPAAPTGLVAAYSFNEGAGTSVADASGSGNGGSIGSATWSTAGKYGNALSFNGTSARVTVPDSPSLRLTAGMTLEAWVFPTIVNGVWRDVIFKGNDNYYLEATSSPGRPVGGGIFGGNYGEVYGSSNLVANTWTHLAATYDGTAVRLFVNGTQVASIPRSGSIATSTGVLSIGGDPLYGQFFAGRIDDVRIYSAARTQAQIQTDMATPIA
jgi:glucose/arabinose dehydrogenase